MEEGFDHTSQSFQDLTSEVLGAHAVGGHCAMMCFLFLASLVSPRL